MFLDHMATICIAGLVLAQPEASKPAVVVDGLVRLIDTVDVPALRDGRLEKIEVREGSYVQAKDVLGRLNDAEATLTVKKTELELQLAGEKAKSEFAIRSARLTQEISQTEFQRATQAKQTAPTSISITEFDRLKLEAEKSTNDLTKVLEEKSSAEIMSQIKTVELDLVRLALAERQIVSPLEGIVVQLYRREGEWIRSGEKAFRIVRINRLRIEGYVDLRASLAVLEKAPVSFEVDFPDSPGQRFAGEVVFIHPEADPVNGQIRLWAEIENRNLMLRPGQRGKLLVFPQSKGRTVQQLENRPLNPMK